MTLEPTVGQIQAALKAGVIGGGTSVRAVAARLHCSESTVHRRLHAGRTSFSAERRAAQVKRAFELLEAGCGPATAAERVSMSRDYLCVSMRDAYGLSPREIHRAVRLADRLRRRPETRPELARFERDAAQLRTLLEPLEATHPLADWAKRLVVLGNRPDYYAPEFLLGLRDEEKRRRLRAQHATDALSVAELSEEECRAPVDVEFLLLESEHARELVRWRRRQLRAARAGVRAYTEPTTGS